MLAGARFGFLVFFLLMFSVAACLPVQAQVNGAPPSVTSLGFGGNNNVIRGVRPSVTSLGPNGPGNNWPVIGNGNCCYNFFLPEDWKAPLLPERRHHRHEDHGYLVGGVVEPVYVPYAVPYAPDAGDDAVEDDAPDTDYVHAPSVRSPEAGARSGGGRDSAEQADASAGPISGGPFEGEAAPNESAPGEASEPVAAQPLTVLVFKDGHRSDVENYAIVGDTLFNFEAGRTRKILLADLDLPATHKANEDRGVDFQVPASGQR
jgi:hypothetical protein